MYVCFYVWVFTSVSTRRRLPAHHVSRMAKQMCVGSSCNTARIPACMPEFWNIYIYIYIYIYICNSNTALLLAASWDATCAAPAEAAAGANEAAAGACAFACAACTATTKYVSI
jgi:hypothetical protein